MKTLLTAFFKKSYAHTSVGRNISVTRDDNEWYKIELTKKANHMTM